MVAEAKAELAKVISRRRLDGGEFSYVLKLGGEPLAGKKAVYTKFRELQPEVFGQLKSSCQQAGETDDVFDTRMLRLIPQLPFEDEKNGEAMEVEEGNNSSSRVTMKAEDLFLVVRVEGVDKKTPQDEVESHFGREFEGVLKVERARDAMSMGARRAPDKRHAAYDITFKEEKFCKAFLDTAELKMGDQVLRSQLLSALIQSKILRRQLNLAFAHNFRLMACAPMEEGKEDSYLLVYGIGRPTDEELQEYFLGLESQFEGIVSAKTVVTGRGEEEGQGKMLGVLVKFESKVALEKFTQLKELKYKEQVVRFNLMGEVVKRNDVRLRKANYVVDDGPTTQQLSSRRVIVLRIKEDYSPDIEGKLKALFPEAKDVRHCTVDKLTVLTFPNQEVARKAVRSQGESDLYSPVNVMLVSEYLEAREKLMEEEADRMEKTKTKYENIKNSCVKVEGNKITITDPNPKIKEKKPKKEDDKKKEVAAKKEVPEKTVVVAQSAPANPTMKKRMNRGGNVFDSFVGVRGFNQYIKNMGKASDMDVCNYFIHNHKDVADVKFVNWTDIVFAKFKTSEAADKFCSLAYHMFYGIELSLHDVPTFLLKKTDQQKEDVTRTLLGKKFNEKMLEGSGNRVANGNGAATTENGGAKPGPPRTPEVELAAFSSKVENIRNLFIENLHLDEEVVGQPKWMKMSGGVDFKARMVIKLEENALGYLVKKWNDLEVAVEGETVVKAELTGATPAKAGGGAAAKRGRRRPNNGGNKRAKISLEDY